MGQGCGIGTDSAPACAYGARPATVLITCAWTSVARASARNKSAGKTTCLFIIFLPDFVVAHKPGTASLRLLRTGTAPAHFAAIVTSADMSSTASPALRGLAH